MAERTKSLGPACLQKPRRDNAAQRARVTGAFWGRSRRAVRRRPPGGRCQRWAGLRLVDAKRKRSRRQGAGCRACMQPARLQARLRRRQTRLASQPLLLRRGRRPSQVLPARAGRARAPSKQASSATASSGDVSRPTRPAAVCLRSSSSRHMRLGSRGRRASARQAGRGAGRGGSGGYNNQCETLLPLTVPHNPCPPSMNINMAIPAHPSQELTRRPPEPPPAQPPTAPPRAAAPPPPLTARPSSWTRPAPRAPARALAPACRPWGSGARARAWVPSRPQPGPMAHHSHAAGCNPGVPSVAQGDSPHQGIKHPSKHRPAAARRAVRPAPPSQRGLDGGEGGVEGH